MKVMIEFLLEDTDATLEEIAEAWRTFAVDDLTNFLEDKVLSGRIFLGDERQFPFGNGAICDVCNELYHVDDIVTTPDQVICQTCAKYPPERIRATLDPLLALLQEQPAKDYALMGKLLYRVAFAKEEEERFRNMGLAAEALLEPLMVKYQVEDEEPVEALAAEGEADAEAEHQVEVMEEEEKRLEHEHQEGPESEQDSP